MPEDEEINKNVSPTYKGILALERKEILTRATICVNLKVIMLGEISQSQRKSSI